MNPRQYTLYTIILSLLVMLSNAVVSQTVVISEVVANNDNSLFDEDGDTSDWIELYNNTDNSISLSGWHLTDDSDNLTKWSFPSTSIPAKSYLIVFASDKDRSVAGAELHTNFKLSSSGEYLALVQANGTDIEHTLTFPELDEDISYGLGYAAVIADPIVLLDTDSPVTAHIPTSAADATGWQNIRFNPSGWLSGTTGVGYETSSGYENLIGLDIVAMKGVNQSVYIRVPFSVDDASAIASLTLKMKYDDGFAAYINGNLVTTKNSPDPLEWNSGGGNHSDGAAVIFEDFDLSPHIAFLNDGANVLAIHGLNYTIDSSDLLFVPKLEATVLDDDISIETVGYLATPTPGLTNDDVNYIDFVETPITSPSRGFYDSSVTVNLTNVTGGATIRYTTDGSEPTTSSTEYTSPITISTTTCLRVAAFIDGWKPSNSRTDTYIFANDVANQSKSEAEINGQALEYGMDSGVLEKTYYDASNQLVTVEDALKAIPSVSITTTADNLYDESTGIYVNPYQRWEVPASLELIYPDGTEGFQINAGLRLRGGASRAPSNPKHSFRMFFRSEYGAGKLKYPLFEGEGVDEFDKIDFRTAQNYSWSKDNSSQNTFLRDIFSRDSAAAMEQTYTRSRYYHLYLNGEYWGLFMTEERPVAAFGASYYGGDKDDYDAIKVIARDQPNAYTIEATDGTTDAYERLYNAAMAGFSDSADYFSIQGLDANGDLDSSNEKLLDVDNLIDYLLVIYYTAASDNSISYFIGRFTGINNMYALYNRENPDGFKWIQHDSEHSIDTNRQLDMTGPFTHENFDHLDRFNPMTLHEKLSVNAEYKIKFADRVYKHLENGGVMTLANSQARLDYRAAQIDRAIVANAARWGNTSRDRDTWVNAVATTREWFERSDERCTEVIEYLDADGLIPSITPPLISQAGGLVDTNTTVSLSGTTGAIYYTTDGTDPRAVGGGIAGARYTSAISITRPTHLKARALSRSGEWSALAEDTYWTADIPLAVTELMYHAPDGNAHDFIEVQNISDETITLKGYKFDNAIDFKFKTASQSTLAPGEYLVVIDDIDSFNTTYPNSSATIAGEYSGNFSNGGEAVDLEFRDNDLISFTYDDARNWPQAADGAGHSIVPLDRAMETQEKGSLDYGGNWRASTYLGGSPGEADPELDATLVINEIWAHTDTDLPPPNDSNDKIELYNASDSIVTISGWYLSDSLSNTQKWLIPDTTISAGGYVVFDETDFHVSEVDGFGLNKAGEQVVLSAPGRIVDVVRFKGQENADTGVTWGRYPDGAEDWIMTIPTHEAVNEPVAATVRISEIMYHPIQAGNDYEYILVENVGATSHTFENSIGTYRIDGGVEFTFPTNTTLAAGERLWILSFNPTIHTDKLNLFCAAYGLNAANETFLGGYSDSLSNRSERVALERPQDSDDPLNPLDLSWVVIDEVFYFDQSPWPSGADGTGYPLLRTGRFSWGAPSASDADADRINDDWELLHFSEMIDPNDDPDADGQTNLQEFIGGSLPTDTSSYFMVQNISALTHTLTWNAMSGRTYSIYRTENLNEPFERIATVIDSPYIDTSTSPEQRTYFYKIVADLQD